MNEDLAQESIAYALKGNWQSAKDINLKILSSDPQNIDALNRLARAYSQLGNNNLAKQTSNKVLKIDPFNTIALKALRRWKVLKKENLRHAHTTCSESFLEEPGKTKVVSLFCLGDSKVLAKTNSGDEVKLDHHSHRVNVVTKDDEYMGRLPDDLSARIKRLITLGNEYQTFVKSIESNEVKIFIRESFRAKKLADTPSFSTEKIDYVSFTPPELVHDKGDLAADVPEEE